MADTKKVTRYDPYLSCEQGTWNDVASMEPVAGGEFVEYDDYATLQAECDTLNKRINDLEDTLDGFYIDAARASL